MIVEGANNLGIDYPLQWALEPGMTKDISWKFIPINEGSNIIFIKIDDPNSVIGNRVPEYNKEDNIIRFDLYIN